MMEVAAGARRHRAQMISSAAGNCAPFQFRGCRARKLQHAELVSIRVGQNVPRQPPSGTGRAVSSEAPRALIRLTSASRSRVRRSRCRWFFPLFLSGTFKNGGSRSGYGHYGDSLLTAPALARAARCASRIVPGCSLSPELASPTLNEARALAARTRQH